MFFGHQAKEWPPTQSFLEDLYFTSSPPTALKEEVKYQSSRNDCVGDEGKKNRKLFSTSKLLSYKNSCQATYLGSNVS